MNMNTPWRNQPQGQRHPQPQVIQQQINLNDLKEEDFVICPECDGTVFIQAFRVIIPQLIVVGERQAMAVPGWQCTECGRFQFPNELKALKELQKEEEPEGEAEDVPEQPA